MLTRPALAPAVCCLATLAAAGCAGDHSPSQPNSRGAAHPATAPSPRPSVFGPSDPRELDLDDLVPQAGRIDHVWYVPAGGTVPEVVVGWSYRGRHVVSTLSDARYALTVWHPVHLALGSARWRSHTLFRGSPFPFRAPRFVAPM